METRSIKSSVDVHTMLKDFVRTDVEEVWVIALACDKTIIKMSMLFRGTVDHCLVHPRDIFRFACLNNASSILLAHNHPTGNQKPSQQDKELTKKLVHIGKMMEIPIVDHVILAKDKYFSFADANLINLYECL